MVVACTDPSTNVKLSWRSSFSLSIAADLSRRWKHEQDLTHRASGLASNRVERSHDDDEEKNKTVQLACRVDRKNKGLTLSLKIFRRDTRHAPVQWQRSRGADAGRWTPDLLTLSQIHKYIGNTLIDTGCGFNSRSRR